MEDHNKKEKINRIYTDSTNPAGYSGFQNLYKIVKEKYPEITKNDVKKFLESNLTYTLFKDRRLKFPRSKFVPLGYMTNLQVDLGDFQSLAKENYGFRFMLVAVDVFSRMVFAVPLKTKTAKDIIPAFEEIFNQMPHLPSEIFNDMGLEFVSKEMKKYFENKGIEKFTSSTGDTKAAVAERFIRTIKLILILFTIILYI
jgi:hypothetical protein